MRILGAGTKSILFSVLIAALALAGPALALDNLPIVGRASVIDGDTIEIHSQRIRLHGIDAPEGGQTCDDARGKPYRCGQKAALALSDKIGRSVVSCAPRDKDRYGRIIAVCRLGSTDLNGWIVSEGWAIAYRYYSSDYVPQEDQARKAKRGIWAGTFTEPYEWRKSQRN